ncbi:hypothetical protein [Oceanicola sp. 502str15]|uniref:hypothetical protein n=1 Tax=Oceanicola sp. 502str15 TaxID=2696061 RepID=UPI002095C1DF|nr:hypothetical protein [Oceanicola sp. 502str15]MCO6384967.1 hypothetical protein [Oceanicola sp. 502str15]
MALLSPAGATTPPAPPLAYYGQDNGSLPPPHRRSFSADIRTDGTATIRRCRGYGEDACVEEVITLPDGAMKAIIAAVRDSGLAATPARKNDRPPIGGKGDWGRVWLNGEELALPRSPDPADAARVRAVLDTIKGAIPEQARARLRDALAALPKE